MFSFEGFGQGVAIAIFKLIAADQKAWRFGGECIQAAFGVCSDILNAGWIWKAVHKWHQICCLANGKGNAEIEPA